jgi:hypothetical protein
MSNFELLGRHERSARLGAALAEVVLQEERPDVAATSPYAADAKTVHANVAEVVDTVARLLDPTAFGPEPPDTSTVIPGAVIARLYDERAQGRFPATDRLLTLAEHLRAEALDAGDVAILREMLQVAQVAASRDRYRADLT